MTYTEEYVNRIYKSISIKQPEELGIKNIATKMKLNVFYGNCSFRMGRDIVIKKSSDQSEWQRFGHEVGHYLRHCGNQLNMYFLFRDLQEYQANYFAYHFCVPTFMLQKFKEVTVYDVMNAFNVEYEFALKRLEMYERKMIYARSHC